MMPDNADTDALPLHARRLVEDARAAGNTVEVKHLGEDAFYVIITDGSGEQWDAQWHRKKEGWRFLGGSDGWVEDMTLNQVRSYATSVWNVQHKDGDAS